MTLFKNSSKDLFQKDSFNGSFFESEFRDRTLTLFETLFQNELESETAFRISKMHLIGVPFLRLVKHLPTDLTADAVRLFVIQTFGSSTDLS